MTKITIQKTPEDFNDRKMGWAAGIIDLLMPMRSDAKLANGREIHLGGFQVIDEKKLNELPQEQIMDFFKKGWLPLIYASLMSSSNWKVLVDMAGEREKQKAN